MVVVTPLILLAAGSLPTLISGAPVPSFPFGKSTPSLDKRASYTYTVFGGTGATAEGWATADNWYPTFEVMFEANKPILESGCTQFGVDNNSDDENNNLSLAIQSVASSTSVDPRFILSIVLQESNGCVRAPTTNYGVVNPGLMQSHDGSGSCNSNGVVQNPCPAEQITQMIHDGTAGTSSGDGLQQLLAQTGVSDVSQYYKAARLYNSGSIAASGNLGQGIATHCYSSDIANRLVGWYSGASACNENTIGTLDAIVGELLDTAGELLGDVISALTPASSATSSTITAAPTSTTSTAAPVAPTVESTTSTTPAAPATPTVESSITAAPTASTSSSATSTTTVIVTSTVIVPAATAPAESTPTTALVAPTVAAEAAATPTAASAAPIYPYAVSGCQAYYTIVTGDYCAGVEAKVGVSASDLMAWNSGLDAACTNLWLGYQYCIQA